MGINWISRDSVRNWSGICVSSTGQYQSATVNGGNIYTSSDYGVTWIPRDSVRSWGSIKISSTGQFQLADIYGGNLYTSTDYGVTWIPRDSVRNWNGTCISSTGRYQSATAYSDYIYTSSNYGVTWIPRDSIRNWRGVSSSSSGAYRTALVAGSSTAYRSINYGVTFNPVSIPPLTPGYISLSSTGQLQTLTGQTAYPFKDIHLSTDYGVTWSSITVDGMSTPTGLSTSSTAQFQSVILEFGKVFISQDYGSTWNLDLDLSSHGRGISMASNNSYHAVVGTQDYIYERDVALVQIAINSSWKKVIASFVIQNYIWKSVADIKLALSNAWKDHV